MRYKSSEQTCSVLKIVSMDPFSIIMHKPVLFHPNFCLLFVAYMEELKKTMLMVMFPNLYIPLLSYYSVQFSEKMSKG